MMEEQTHSPQTMHTGMGEFVAIFHNVSHNPNFEFREDELEIGVYRVLVIC